MLHFRLSAFGYLALLLTVSTAARPMPLVAQVRTSAGVVGGTVLDDNNNRPVAGAIVQGLHRDSVVARTLTDERGRFTITAASMSVVRVRRIGYRPVDVPITSAAGELTIHLAPLTTLLQPVAVRANARCATGPTVATAHAVYEQVRDALLAQIVTRETRPARSLLLRFRGPIDDPSRPMVTQEVALDSLQGETQTFTAVRSAAEFVQLGFAKDSAGARVFLGPDADFLTDDLFRTNWCLDAAERDRNAPTLVGIRFTPASRRASIVDIDGRLWVDTATRTLKRIEYAYRNLSDAEMSVAPGGRIEFRTMPSGAVFVERWTLRLAQYANLNAALSSLRGPSRSRVSALESGGEVARMQWADGAEWRGTLGALRLTARDDKGAPQRNVTLALAGTGYAARTDNAGVAVFEDVLPGRYRVVVSDSVLDLVGVTLATSLRADVARGAMVERTLVAPSRASFAKEICPADNQARRVRRYDAQADSLTEIRVEPDATAVVLVRVVDSVGVGLRDVTVFDAVTRAGSAPLETPRAPRVRTDGDGRAVSCWRYAPGETIQVLAQPDGAPVQGRVHMVTSWFEGVVLVVRR